MAAAGIYTMGGAFWEFGEPDWDRTKLFMIFGVAEDHDSNPIKIGLGKLKARGAKVIGVNPIRTGYNAIADEWVGITPGTDGLFILALVHVLMKAGKIDLDYLARFTNAPCLVDGDPKARRVRPVPARRGRQARWSSTGAPASPRPSTSQGVQPDLGGHLAHAGVTHRTVLPAHGRTLPDAGLRARGGAPNAPASPPPRIRAHRRRARPTSPSTRPSRSTAMDRFPRRDATRR